MPLENPLVRRLRDWQNQRADEKLFRQLARTHELDSVDVEQLVAVADHYRLVRLSEVFLRPALLQGHNVADGPTLLEQRQLSRKIFGEAVAENEATEPEQKHPRAGEPTLSTDEHGSSPESGTGNSV